jgi:hypothetical protein
VRIDRASDASDARAASMMTMFAVLPLAIWQEKAPTCEGRGNSIGAQSCATTSAHVAIAYRLLMAKKCKCSRSS